MHEENQLQTHRILLVLESSPLVHMQHATMINKQLALQIEKAQQFLTNINENIRIKQEQHNNLIRQEQLLTTKME